MKTRNILLNIVTSVMLLINYSFLASNGLLSILKDKSFVIRIMLMAVLFIVLQKNSKGVNDQKDKYLNILCFLFGIFLLVGDSYRTYGTIKAIYSFPLIIVSILKYISLCHILKIILYKVKSILDNKKWKSFIKSNRFIAFFDKHPFLTPFIILACSWSIYYIAFYPIVLSPDPSYQIRQALGERTKYSDYSILLDEKVNITNHHPVIHTLLLGTCLRIGRALINDNFGLFIYSFIQGVFMALTLSWSIKYLKEKGVNDKYLIFMIMCYAFVPMFPFYAINANKDVYYSLFIMWLLMLLFDIIHGKEKITFKKGIGLFLILLLICLFRNNGVYLIVLIYPFMLIYNRINIKQISIIFLSVFCLFFGYKHFLLPSLKITDTSPREAMSLFFQQTARYVINHEDELTNSDKEIIGTIIDYDIIKTKYNSKLSDPIKNTYNKFATKEDLAHYFKVWFKGLAKHPMTYVDATVNNVYGYFDPGDISWYIYYKFNPVVTKNGLVDYHYNNLSMLRNILTLYGTTFICIPLIGLISNIGINAWIVIAYTIWILREKRFKYIVMVLPALISLLICIASPVNTYFRYAMPFVFPNLFLIGTWLLIKKN